MKPDIVFCHGPFIQGAAMSTSMELLTLPHSTGDYRVGETLLAESAMIITFCGPVKSRSEEETDLHEALEKDQSKLHQAKDTLKTLSLSNMFTRSRTPSPEPALTPLPNPPSPRRLVILAVGLKPHRKLWTLSARPGESVINYILLNGCPTIVVPAKVGAPLVAWDGLTLEQFWEVELPADDSSRTLSGKFEGIVDVLFEYLDLCVDWDRFEVINAGPGEEGDKGKEMENKPKSIELSPKRDLKDAVTLLVVAIIRSKDSKEARKEIDASRGGIAMWRIP